MSNKYAILFAFVLAVVSKVSLAQDLIFPLVCSYGQDCWAVNYVDMDEKTGGAIDSQCKSKTYDGHKGSDFALGSIAQMNKGVDVVAVASGAVLRMRDGESDALKSEAELEALKAAQRECGNGVLVDHGNGLQTIYCHLKQGSIAVKQGDKLRAGQKIGEVGQSGMAEFPHLHIGVFDGGKIIDPFSGARVEEGCGQVHKSYWSAPLGIQYQEAAIFDGGFKDGAPDFEAIKRGAENPNTLPLESAALVFWAGIYNVEQGDDITLRIYDPQGKLFAENLTKMERNRARQYLYAGRKTSQVSLVQGTYKGHVDLERENGFTLSREFEVHITPR